MLPPHWADALCCKGKGSQLPLAVRKRMAISILKRSGISPLRNAKGAFAYWTKYCKANSLCDFPASADIVTASLEEYDEHAHIRAAARRAKRSRKGKQPARTDRGGDTAASWVRNGYQLLEDKVALPFDSKGEMARAVARAGKGMPSVASATPLDLIPHVVNGSRNPHLSNFIRAYMGAQYITIAASLRKIDAQRSGAISFERITVDGHPYTIACGIARKSKAKRQDLMRPLAWRAPLIPFSGVPQCVDLHPLLNSLPPDGGCLFRGFLVPKGKPRSIMHATQHGQIPRLRTQK
jgi:hypothetical protein